MNNIELKLDAEPKDNYEKAKHDLLQALKSYDKLTPQQKECLMKEFIGATNMTTICTVLKQYFG